MNSGASAGWWTPLVGCSSVRRSTAITSYALVPQASRAFDWGLSGQTVFTLQTDARAEEDPGLTYFCPVADVHGDIASAWDWGEVGPGFGLDAGKIYLNSAQWGTTYWSTGSTVQGEWYQVQLRVDTAANGGDGEGDVYARNLTDSETAFTAVAGLQDIALNLTAMAGAGSDPGNWDNVYIYGKGTGDIHTLDNFGVIPEPSTIVLWGTGLLGLAFVARRKRRR